MSTNPKTIQKPTTVPPHIFVNNGWMRTFQIPILCACMVGRHMSHTNQKDSFILGAAVPGEASETMVELCLWPSIVLLRKLVIYWDYLVLYTLRTMDVALSTKVPLFCTLCRKTTLNDLACHIRSAHISWFLNPGLWYKFSHPFEPPVEACTSFYVGILAQKATRLGSLLDPGW